VLVNYNDSMTSDPAKDILGLADNIQRMVAAEFGIDLDIEPRIYGSL